MKRLISLSALVICSFTISFSAAQTWRLTNDGNSVLPRIAIGKAGCVWVTWLSETPGNFDVYCRKFEGAAWGDTFRICTDDVNQYSCDIAYDSSNDRTWIVWDSCNSRGYIKGAYYHSDSIVSLGVIVDSINSYKAGTGLFLSTDVSGNIYLAWTSDSNYAAPDGMIRSYSNNSWDNIQKVFAGYDGGMLGGTQAQTVGMTSSGDAPPVVLGRYVGGSMGGFSWVDIMYGCWSADSSKWLLYPVDSWSGNIGNSNQAPTAVAIHRKDDILFTAHCGNTAADSISLICNRYDLTSSSLDTSFIIKPHCRTQSGAMAGIVYPTLAWSDTNSIFLNAYNGTTWSQPSLRISDTTLHSCFNPDIVAVNDSTVWVCYQNDADIYVTRTSVPLGVTGDRPDQKTISVKPFIQAYPNPASNRVNISYTNRGQSELSIYDITGGRIRSLTANNGQAIWDCRDQQGHRVSSGVYFIRAGKVNNEIIKKINVVR